MERFPSRARRDQDPERINAPRTPTRERFGLFRFWRCGPGFQQGTPEGIWALSPVLIDTGALVALFDRSEQHHEACAAAIEQIDAPLVTCEAVLAETCYLLRSFRNAGDALLENIENGTFLVPYRVVGKTKAPRRLLKKYANVPMDFADACLVDMADEYQTSRILTLDGDFHIYRWGKNRPFDFVLDGL
jgi:uncharacterized protein